jgi:two-component system, chemotaxis family, CheB/CheR fusion protein
MNAESDETFEVLLRFLRDSRGFDFTGYKRASLMRRVRHRMEQIGCETFEEYLDLLQANTDEFAALFNTILINVTDFFRDLDAWEFLRREVIPVMLAERSPTDAIRVWSAGCASGQEAYTLAMVLAEVLGLEAFRERVKIYATDVDEDALTEARAASYDAKAVEAVPQELREKYFDNSGSRYSFRKDLRRAVIFGRNDLVKDAPISRVDLLVCRNTLMYLNGETQRLVLGRLHFALAPKGILFLGHAEMLLSDTDRFTPINLQHRVFRKALGSHRGYDRFDPAPVFSDRHDSLQGLDPLRELAFRASPVAQIVVTDEDTIAMINQQAETLFRLSTRDIGRELRDLEVSFRPVELRGYLEQARVERRSARIQDVKWQRPGAETTWFEVHVNPLVDAENRLIGVSIVFFDMTANRALLDKVIQTNRQVESAYEEMQSTNEELETTNEELQSTVEELETTNEELQSTNEELETMNEELQSTNDELQTINDALRDTGAELDNARAFLSSLVNSTHLGIVVVDREMRVVVWNRRCEELWGVRPEEATGSPFTALDIGLPITEVRPLIGNAFVDSDSDGEVVVDAVNRRGHPIQVRVMCTAFRSDDDTVNGALLMMDAPA